MVFAEAFLQPFLYLIIPVRCLFPYHSITVSEKMNLPFLEVSLSSRERDDSDTKASLCHLAV